MPRLLLLLLSLFLAACAASGEKGDSPRPSSRFTLRPNVTCSPPGWPKTLLADLYLPEGTAPRPAVIVIHGGSWRTKDKRYYMAPVAKSLARRGFVALNVTYRGAPTWRYPAPVEDVREAVKWLRRHATEYHIDPRHIGIFGYSAGAQIAAQVALGKVPREAKIQAVVAGGIPANLALYTGGKVVPGYVGGALAVAPKAFYAASPVNFVTPSAPPFFLYHGSRDRIVPPEHAIQFDAALTRAGVKHELLWLPGKGHLTTFFFGGSAVKKAIDFLDRTLRPPPLKASPPAGSGRPLPARG